MSKETKWVGKLIPHNIFFQVQDAEDRPFENLKDMTFAFGRIHPNDLLYTPRLHPEIRKAIEDMCDYVFDCNGDIKEAASRVRTYLSYIPEE